MSSCLSICKDTNLKAIHNGKERIVFPAEVVYQFAKIRFFLRITTDVYMLPNPKNTRSTDYILRKDNKLYYTEGKFLTGKNSLDHKFYKEQSERISIDVMSSISANYVSSIVKTSFEQYGNLKEVILFKGSRMITIDRRKTGNKKFEKFFVKIWNKNK